MDLDVTRPTLESGKDGKFPSVRSASLPVQVGSHSLPNSSSVQSPTPTTTTTKARVKMSDLVDSFMDDHPALSARSTAKASAVQSREAERSGPLDLSTVWSRSNQSMGKSSEGGMDIDATPTTPVGPQRDSDDDREDDIASLLQSGTTAVKSNVLVQNLSLPFTVPHREPGSKSSRTSRTSVASGQVDDTVGVSASPRTSLQPTVASRSVSSDEDDSTSTSTPSSVEEAAEDQLHESEEPVSRPHSLDKSLTEYLLAYERELFDPTLAEDGPSPPPSCDLATPTLAVNPTPGLPEIHFLSSGSSVAPTPLSSLPLVGRPSPRTGERMKSILRSSSPARGAEMGEEGRGGPDGRVRRSKTVTFAQDVGLSATLGGGTLKEGTSTRSKRRRSTLIS